MVMRLGTAELMDPKKAAKQFPYRAGSVWIGSGLYDGMPLGYEDDSHVLLVAGTRGGKGTTTIMNTLALYPGSALVLDPKGENASVTACRRGPGSEFCEGMGQKVYCLDPMHAATIPPELRAHFNPLDELKPENCPHAGQIVDEARRIASALIIVQDEDKNSYFQKMAQEMAFALILYIMAEPIFEGRRNLITFRDLIMRGAFEEVAQMQEWREQGIPGYENPPTAQGQLWAYVKSCEAFSGEVARSGALIADILDASAKTFEFILSEIVSQTTFLSSPQICEVLQYSDFSLKDLKEDPRGVTVYVSLPPRHMAAYFRWLRLMVELTLAAAEKSRHDEPATGFPTLMLMDEFAGLNRMTCIERAAAQIADAGIKLFFVVQNIGQIKDVYKGAASTITSACELQLYFAVRDYETAKLISDTVGNTEVARVTKSSGKNETDSETETDTKTRNTSHNRQRQRSRTRSTGRGVQHGGSVADGTSESDGSSESKGGGESWQNGDGSSESLSRQWQPGLFNLWTSWKPLRTETWSSSRNFSHGLSKNWQVGRNRQRANTHTESRNHATTANSGEQEGMSDGTGDTVGLAVGKAKATGKTKGWQEGENESLHTRALLPPDLIMRLFARRLSKHPAFPGAGLALIEGEAVVFRRVVYYQAPAFFGCFDPHPRPKHRSYYVPTPKISISAHELKALWSGSQTRHVVFTAMPGTLVRKGDPIGTISPGKVVLCAPRNGRVEKVSNFSSDDPNAAGSVLEFRYMSKDRDERLTTADFFLAPGEGAMEVTKRGNVAPSWLLGFLGTIAAPLACVGMLAAIIGFLTFVGSRSDPRIGFIPIALLMLSAIVVPITGLLVHEHAEKLPQLDKKKWVNIAAWTVIVSAAVIVGVYGLCDVAVEFFTGLDPFGKVMAGFWAGAFGLYALWAWGCVLEKQAATARRRKQARRTARIKESALRDQGLLT